MDRGDGKGERTNGERGANNGVTFTPTSAKLKDGSTASASTASRSKTFLHTGSGARASKSSVAPFGSAGRGGARLASETTSSTSPPAKITSEVSGSSPSPGTMLPQPSRQLTEDQRAEIQEAFELFDSDKDGSLDYHEFKVSLKALGFEVSREKAAEISQLLQKYDRAGTGLISEADFVTIMTEKMLQRDPEEEMKKAFKLFANPETGTIDLSALRAVAEELELENPCGEEELQAMIEEFDQNQDGVIDEAEFMEIMTQSHQFDF
eukprot:gb/GEZN01016490.1/.p1 GENE.gb/GEZN01016490.1/~~gb/GEZN01016490.1/.p1  ORF type:complete len:265 (+),score=40.36 gb/GEZN01016490.1/:34-828(+)